MKPQTQPPTVPIRKEFKSEEQAGGGEMRSGLSLLYSCIYNVMSMKFGLINDHHTLFKIARAGGIP